MAASFNPGMPARSRFATSRPTAPRPARPIFKGAFNDTPFFLMRALQRGFLRELFFEPRDVLQQALARELQEIEPELRVLEVELAQFFVAQRQHLAVGDAFERGGAPVLGR